MNQATDIKATKVFKYTEDTYNDKKYSVIVHQGGTRSGKTYNILLWLISKCVSQWDNKVIDIVRKSFPSLRASAMFDFYEILTKYGMYSDEYHNKTENIYKIGSNIIRFFSCDEPQKMRGPGRDILFCNEANELTFEDFTQLNMRTREMTILDFNPSDEFHWIYDRVLIRTDVNFFVTTYKDNLFLPKRIIQEIENLKDVDENYWRIYGLGQRGISQATIYSNWELTDEPKPQGYQAIGLDFGYNDPTSMIEIVLVDAEKPYIWMNELIYQSHMTNNQVIEKMKDLNISKNVEIYGDSSRPETINEILRAGYNIRPTVKGAGSIKLGIDFLKRYKLKITKTSLNLQKEIKNYKWKTNKDGQILDEPVEFNDHSCDAARYALNSKIQFKQKIKPVIVSTRIY